MVSKNKKVRVLNTNDFANKLGEKKPDDWMLEAQVDKILKMRGGQQAK